MKSEIIQAGTLLISQPEPGDPRFETSVSLICDHDKEGSFALTLNKPTELFINIEDFSISDSYSNNSDYPLWLGGPVQIDQCFFLFQNSHIISDAEEIIPGLFLSSSRETLKLLLHSNVHTELKIKFFIGYAGWSFYQLDCEVSYGWWLLAKGNKSSPFQSDPTKQWLNSLKSIDEKLFIKGQSFLDSQ